MSNNMLRKFQATAETLRNDARREYMGSLFDAVGKELPYENEVLTAEYPSDKNLHGSFIFGSAWCTYGGSSNHLCIKLNNGWDFSRGHKMETLAHFHVKQRQDDLVVILLGDNDKPLSGKPLLTIKSGRTKPTKTDERKFFDYILDLFPEAVKKVHASKKAYDDAPCGL